MYTRTTFQANPLQCPYRIHGLAFDQRSIPLSGIRRTVQRDLDYLTSQGCRRIGIHLPDDFNKVKTGLRAVADWLETHPDAVDALFFVDAQDDYFNCFGLESFKKDRSVCNPSPTEFESYYEQKFIPEMEKTFGPCVKNDGIQGYVITKDDVLKKTQKSALPINFSVGFFYTILVPQVIAKVTGKLQDTYDFLRVSKMPMIDRLMGGFMDPYAILSDTGLLPKNEGEISEWIRLAKEETEYFFRVIIHHIIGGIQPSTTAPAKRLFRLNGQQIKAMRQEMKEYLKKFEACLKGGPAPKNYYLSEEIRCQETESR